MRQKLAELLVKFVSSLWDLSYKKYCEDGKGEPWGRIAGHGQILLNVAMKLDKETAVETMVECGWWG